MLQKTCFRAWFIAVFVVQPFHPARNAAAQDPIRVQSDEVLVPTVVFDKELYAKLNKQEPHHRTTYGKMVAKNAKLWNDIVVKNLTAKDFHLFEDDQEQKIGSVKLEPPAFRVVQDNFGKHPEIVGSGGGLWAYPDLPRDDMSVWLAWPQYVLAYVPPRSAAGSCHRIQVKVGRANLIVWTRSEYCNTPHPASDPLNGTEFGNKLGNMANRRASSGIDLKLNVATFVDTPNAARVYVSANFPKEVLQHEIRDGILYATIGSLVLVYREDGTLAARYSDFACCDYGDKKESKVTENEMPSPSTTGAGALLPNRYETQFLLPPGKYVARVVISDGLHFGVEETPLTVESYNAEKLSVTGLALARRVQRLPQNKTEEERVAGSYSPLVSKEVEFTPTASMDFFRGDTLFAYFEISKPVVAGQSDPKVRANLRILDSKSGSVANTFEPVDTATYIKVGDPVIAVGRGVMLEHFSPGTYRLEVQATDAGGQSSAWRSAEFTVIEAPPLELNDAASPKEKKDDVIVNVTVLDANNHAVTDLTSAEFQIFDDDQPRTITSYQATSRETQADGFSSPVVILFDLLNTNPWKREYVAGRLIKVLQSLETDQGIYLYLLTNDGDLVSVRPKGTPQAAAIAEGSIAGGSSGKKNDAPPWTKEIRPLLERAVNQAHGFSLDDYKDVYWRTSLTFQKLDELARDFAIIRGPKTLLWVTSGVPITTSTPYLCKDAMINRDDGSYLSGKCTADCPLPKAPDIWALVGTCLDYTPFLAHFTAETAASDTRVSSVAVTQTGLQDFQRGTAANTLKQLGDLTGGTVYQDTVTGKAVREAVETSKVRYRLEFAPAAWDGKYHKVRVACTREGVRIVAPQAYFASMP